MELKNQKLLLKLARGVLEGYFRKEDFNLEEKVAEFDEKRGVFVSLHKKNKLRGCVGSIEPIGSVYYGVKEMALSAALKDRRFSPLREEELKEVRIEISVLSKPEKLAYSGEEELLSRLRPEIDGVILEKKWYSATFLPQVWKRIPEKRSFLEHLSVKAGLPAGGWKKAEIYTYQAEVFWEGF